ncbi:MAG: hypothetical protein ABIP97_13870 [Chthoniobacterales bacterium]
MATGTPISGAIGINPDIFNCKRVVKLKTGETAVLNISIPKNLPEMKVYDFLLLVKVTDRVES